MAFTAVARVQKFAPGEDSTQVNFYPAYDNPENEAWSKYTPSLSISLYMKNEIAEMVDTSKEYLITFTERD